VDASFFDRDPAKVARELLGCTLFRKRADTIYRGRIVETEAYYAGGDPASRARHGRKAYNAPMFDGAGHLFVYNVHRYWMLNFVAHEPGKVGAVLIRAIEPTLGIEAMRASRCVDEDTDLTTGPGKLTIALNVDRSLNGLPVTDETHPVHVLDNHLDFEIGRSNRIGVTKDLSEKLRFYMKGNRFVSR